jgi:energy-coupling factor transporter ATP-binding protein EcfA2
MKARNNPFACDRWETLPFQFQDTTEQEVLIKLALLNYRCAIWGKEGSGKTTLLEQIARRLRQEGQLVAVIILSREERRAFKKLCSLLWLANTQARRMIICLDGADCLPRPLWWALWGWSHRWRGLIVTSHRPGMLPELIHCQTDEALLDWLLCELLNKSDLGTIREMAQEIFRLHEGNIREVFRRLYCYFGEDKGRAL